MSDDETRPIEPDAPVPPSTGDAEQPPPYGGGPPYATQQPPHAMPLPAGYPGYAVPPQQRPRFGDQVIGMWAVVAVALACLVVGGLSGFILRRASPDGQDRFMRGPGMMQFQRGPNGFSENGFPNGPNGFPNQQPNQQQPSQSPSNG